MTTGFFSLNSLLIMNRSPPPCVRALCCSLFDVCWALVTQILWNSSYGSNSFSAILMFFSFSHISSNIAMPIFRLIKYSFTRSVLLDNDRRFVVLIIGSLSVVGQGLCFLAFLRIVSLVPFSLNSLGAQ